MYNKSRFNKLNDKKVLHKVRKNWVTISVALLGLIGGGAVATNVTANADTNSNQNNNVNQNTNTVKQHLNQTLVSDSSHLQKAQPQQNSNASNSIAQQANALHSHILASNFSQSNHAQQGQSVKSNQDANSASVNNSDNKVLSNQAQNVVGQTEKAPMNEVDNASGTFEGLNYTSDGNGTVTFTGTLNQNPSDFLSQGRYGGLPSNTVTNAKKLVFGTNTTPVNFGYQSTMENMFNDSTDLGPLSDIDFNNVEGMNHITNMATVFGNGTPFAKLKNVQLGKGFDMSGAQGNDSGFIVPGVTFTKTANNYVDPSLLSQINQNGYKNQKPSANQSQQTPNWGTDTFTEGTATVKYDTSNDTIIVSNGNLADTHDNSSAALPTQIVDTTKGFNVESDMLPNTDKTWTLTFKNVTAPSDLFFTLDGKNESTGRHNFIGNQVAHVDLSGLKTGNTTTMEGLLINNPNLQSVNFGNIDTSKVANMAMMLGSDPSLTSADLSSLSGASLNTAYDVFDKDPNLTSVKLGSSLSPRDGSNANLGEFFASDTKLPFSGIQWNNFDTKNATSLYGFFRNDQNLGNIDLPSTFDTSNAQNMGEDPFHSWGNDGMFQSDGVIKGNPNATQSIDLSHANFNTSNVTSMDAMFRDDKNLKSINFGNNFNTSKVKSAQLMFGYSDAISDLNLPSGFDTTSNSNRSSMNMSDMFESDNFNTITINNPKTKISVDAWKTTGMPKLYKETGEADPNNKPVTSKAQNNFLQGNTGTFTSKNVPAPGTPLHSLPHNDSSNKQVTDAIRFITSDGTFVDDEVVTGTQGQPLFPNDKPGNIVPDGYQLDSDSSKNGKSFKNTWSDTDASFGNPEDSGNEPVLNDKTNSLVSDPTIDGMQYHIVVIKSDTGNKIPVSDNEVNVSGIINLHFVDSNDGSKDRVIPLHFEKQMKADDPSVNLLNYIQGLKFPSSDKVSDFTKNNDVASLLTQTAGFNVDNYSWDKNNGSNSPVWTSNGSTKNDTKDYNNFKINASDAGYANGSTVEYSPNDYNLYFDVNNTTDYVKLVNANTGSDVMPAKNSDGQKNIKISGLNGGTVAASNIYKSDIPSDYIPTGNNASLFTINGSGIGSNDSTPYSIYVLPKQVTDTINYSDNGPKGTTQITGNKDSTISPNDMPNVPNGYHIKGTPSAAMDGRSHTIQVLPNQVADTIVFVNGNGDGHHGKVLGSYITGNGSDGSTLNNTDDKIITHLSNDSAISKVFGSNGYTATTSDGNNDLSKIDYDGHTHVIWVTGNNETAGPTGEKNKSTGKVKGQLTNNYNVAINVQEINSDGKYIKSDGTTTTSTPTTNYTYYVGEGGHVGSDFSLTPGSYAPDGFNIDPEDQVLNGTITSSGDNPSSITWTYSKSKSNSKSTIVYYHLKDNNNDNKGAVVGSGAKNENASDGTSEKVSDVAAIPKGYKLDTSYTDGLVSKNGTLNYSVKDGQQVLNLVVNPKSISSDNDIKNQNVHVATIYKNKNGHVVTSSDYYIPISELKKANGSGNVQSIGDSYQVSDTDSHLHKKSGYSLASDDKTLYGQITPDGVSHSSVTFVYKDDNDDGSITVDFKGLNNQNMGTKTVNYNPGSDLSLGSNDIPKGYHIVPGQDLRPAENQSNMDVNVVPNNLTSYVRANLVYKFGNKQVKSVIGVPVPVDVNPNVGSEVVHASDSKFMVPGYQPTSSDWNVAYNGDPNAYSQESHTFYYDATPVDIKIDYKNDNSGNGKVTTSGYTTDLGKVGIEGQKININADDNTHVGVITGQGIYTDNPASSEVMTPLRFAVPTGYHLVHSNNIMTVTPNKSTNDQYGNYVPVMLLSLVKDTGATPAIPSQPTSSGANNHDTTPAGNGGSIAPSNNGSNGSSSADSNNSVPSTPNNNGSNSASSSNRTPNQPNQPASNNSNHSGSANSNNDSHANQPAKSAGNKGNSVSPSSNGSSSAGSNGNIPNRPNIPNNAGSDDHSHSANNGGGTNPINPDPSPQPSNNGGNDQPVNPGNNVPNNDGNITPDNNANNNNQPNNDGNHNNHDGNVTPSNNNNDGDNVAPSNTPIAPVNPMPSPQPTPSSSNNNSNGSQASIGQVVVTYVDGKNHVINRTSVGGTKGSAFQPANYTSLAPSGYQVDHIITGGNISNFNNGIQNLVVQVNKDQNQQPASASASDNAPQPASASNSSDNVPAASSSDPNANDIIPASSSVAPSSSSASSSDSATSDSESNPGSTSNHSSSAKPASSSSRRNSAANSNNSDSDTSSDTDSDSDDSSDNNSNVPSDTDSTDSDTDNDEATSSSQNQTSTTGNSSNNGGTTNTGADDGMSTSDTANTDSDDATSDETNANGTSGTSTNNDANGSSSKLPQTGENNYSKNAALAMLGLDAIIGGLGLGRKRRRHDE